MYNSTWYLNLHRPFLTPPAEVFPSVWIILYGMIFAGLIIYTIKPTLKPKTAGYVYFVIQMILNCLWSPIFFGLRNIGFAMIVIVLLDIFVFLTIKKFFCVSKLAGAMLIPYFIWILFATYLNAGFFILN